MVSHITSTSLLLLLSSWTVAADLDHLFTIPLYGEKLKGFVTVENVKDDQYVLSFKLDEAPDDTRLSLHMAAAPYDSGVMAENCRRARKSPHIFRDQPVKETTVESAQLSGHTLILGNVEQIYACTTVILGSRPLLYANFHEDPIQGPIHIIPMKDKIRILPDLKYVPLFDGSIGVEFIDWAFVESCDNTKNAYQNAVGMELGIDSRATLTIETAVNVSLINFQIFRNGKPFACAPIQNVERRGIKAAGVYLTQPHYFTAVRSEGDQVDLLNIREDCLDVSTETVHNRFHAYFPSVSIFGPDTIMFKSIVLNTTCHTLRPQFPLPVAIADFFHPTVGRLALVDTDDRIILTGNLRSLFDTEAARATVQVSPKFAPSEGCPLYLDDCADCFTVPDAAVIVGKDDEDVALIGVLPYFNLSEMKSIIVDLQWTEEPFHVCTNLTHLPNGALQASMAARRYTPISFKTMATVVVLEYPANGYSEVILNKKAAVTSVEAHSRPIDMSVTTGPPCGEQTIGPKIASTPWLEQLEKSIKSETNTSSFTVRERLISGSDSLLGTSLLLAQDNEYYCGSFSLPEEKKRLVAKFGNEQDSIKGYIIMSQYISSGEVPTEVIYAIDRINTTDKESFKWEIVDDSNGTCTDAEVFNPFQLNVADCSPSKRHMCPIGDVSTRSSDLICGTKHHQSISGLPLSGPNSVSGRSIRLTSTSSNETIECAKLIEMEDASFSWMVYSNQTLSSLQQLIAKRLHLEFFNIMIDYNRELFGGRCSVHRVTILETNERLADILTIFDVERKKFREDAELVCTETETTASTTYITTTSVPKKQTIEMKTESNKTMTVFNSTETTTMASVTAATTQPKSTVVISPTVLFVITMLTLALCR